MSTKRSQSLSKKSETAPAGGEFLINETPTSTFAPEDLPADAHLVGRALEEFIRREVAPNQERLENHESRLLRRLVQQAGKLGFLAGGLPKPYALGLPKTTNTLLAEKSAACLSFAVTIGVHAGVAALPLLFFGTEDQNERYLSRIATGEVVAAFALTEANAGSDALAVQTLATPAPAGDGYLLDGTKLWVTNAGIADLFTVFAHLEGAGLTAFLVDRSTPGLIVGPEENKLGLRGSSTCRVMLNQSLSQGLGDPGEGRRPALYALNPGRFQIGAIALGGAKEALRFAMDYALHRRQSGREIASFGLIQQKLAEMATRIFTLESMVYRTAGYWDAHVAHASGEQSSERLAAAAEEYAIECALIKFSGTETLDFAVDEALQIYGGYGYSEDYPIARLYRDARIFRIFEGTNEINRLAVFQQLRRRAERGRLPLDAAIAQMAEPPAWPATNDPLAYAGIAVAQIRHVLLAAFERVRRVPTNQDSQVAHAAIADLCAILYGLESAWLRVGKLPRGSCGVDMEALLCMLQFAAEAACRASADFARIALISAGADSVEVSRVLPPLNSRPLVNVESLHKSIVRSVIEPRADLG